MAGCFGNHPYDRYLSRELDKYLDSFDDFFKVKGYTLTFELEEFEAWIDLKFSEILVNDDIEYEIDKIILGDYDTGNEILLTCQELEQIFYIDDNMIYQELSDNINHLSDMREE